MRNLFRFIIAVVILITKNIYTKLGKKDKYCPCCGWRGAHFLPYIDVGYVTFGAECPDCHSHPRHRGHRCFYEKYFNNLKGSLLYIAPERNVNFFKGMKNLNVKTSEYPEKLSADFNYNLCNIDSPGNVWDYIICHRVIEHLPDDRKGMNELYRILKHGGICILSVPIKTTLARTIEYGMPNPFETNHYYCYGNDFRDRIPEAFDVEVVEFNSILSPQEYKSMSLYNDSIFICKKSD